MIITVIMWLRSHMCWRNNLSRNTSWHVFDVADKILRVGKRKML